MYLPLVEAALRYGIVGALAIVAASAPVMAGYEWLRSDRFAPHDYRVDYVTLQLGIEVLLGLIVGWLMLRLLGQSTVAEARAAEAEKLRDQLGRRADALEAATAAPGRSAPRSSSTRPSTLSSARCAGCCRSTGSRSCSARTASRR